MPERLLETSLRQSMTLSHGSLWFLLTRPIAVALTLATGIVLVLPSGTLLLRAAKVRLRRAEEA